jgi:hypothetical protein
MKCQKVKKQLVLFAGNDLPERKMKSVQSHIKHCPTCKDELEEFRNMKESVNSITQKDIPDTIQPDFAEKVVQQIAEEIEFLPLRRTKSPNWFLQNPVRTVGIVALAFILIGSAALFLLSPGKAASEKLAEKILSISERGSPELEWDPKHIFFKTFTGPYRLDSWEAPKQSGVYAVLHKRASGEGPITYIIDYCGESRNLSSFRGYPWIHHRMKRLISRTGSRENVYIAVFLMPDSSKQERRQIEEALLKTFNPYFNRGV